MSIPKNRRSRRDLLLRDTVAAMWILLSNSTAQGHRGVRLETVDIILALLNHGVLAQVPSRGSVGASGDLATSAHAALLRIGEVVGDSGPETQFLTNFYLTAPPFRHKVGGYYQAGFHSLSPRLSPFRAGPPNSQGFAGFFDTLCLRSCATRL
jgi:hypothetical protein